MKNDLTLGTTYRRLIANGYAPTSASHPDRYCSRPDERDSFLRLSDHPAAVMCYPRASNGCALEDCAERGVVALVITVYLLEDAQQWKAVQAALAGFLTGPYAIDVVGNRTYLLRWDGPPIFDGEQSARLAFDADDSTVFLEHAIAPVRQLNKTDQWGNNTRVAGERIGSHAIALDGEWKGGTLLDTPRAKLPELTAADLARLIPEVERARWGARPLVMQKDAAA